MGATNNQKLTRAKKTPGYTGGGLLHVIKDLNETDVLLGRGTGPSEHKGNREFRYLIAKRTNEFNSTDNRQTKSRIAEQTVRDVKVKNGRFLRRLEKSEYRFISDKTSAPELDDVLYVQVDDVTAVLKTKQAFRYCSRTVTVTTTPHAVAVAVAVASPTTGGIIPSRARDPVRQEHQDESKSLLVAGSPLRQAQALYEQLKAAEMEIKSAAILKRMWQNELLAQQQEHHARLATSNLLGTPSSSRYFLGPSAQNSSLENELLVRASAITSSPAPRSALMTSSGLEREGPVQVQQQHAILAGSAGDYLTQQHHGGMSHFVAGRPVPAANSSRACGAELLLSLLDQQARCSSAARMKIGGTGFFDLPSTMLLQPRLSASSAGQQPGGGNVHPAAYRLHEKQMQY
jgi:hypothetical protein